MTKATQVFLIFLLPVVVLWTALAVIAVARSDQRGLRSRPGRIGEWAGTVARAVEGCQRVIGFGIAGLMIALGYAFMLAGSVYCLIKFVKWAWYA